MPYILHAIDPNTSSNFCKFESVKEIQLVLNKDMYSINIDAEMAL